MKKILLCIFSLFILTTAIHAQNANRTKFIADSLQAYVSRALTNWRVPGTAVCIIKDNRIVLVKGFGVKELGLNNKVDENTRFMIGSNTKAFTATAIAMLAAEKKLSLNDKVTKYLPDFKLDNKAATELLTVRDLLCHRLGFQTFQGDFTFYNTNLTRSEVMSKMALIKAPYGFRTTWGYTNSAFLTAGEIIPKVTDQNWDIYLKEKIFAPLGMSNTLGLSVAMPKAFNRSAGHTITDNRLIAIPYANLDNMAPAGAISSTAVDMGKWVMALLNNGKVGNKQVIPEAAIAATRQPQDIVGTSEHLDGTKNFQLYGLGWFLEDYHNHRLVMHDGGVNGFVSSVTLVPEENLGIVILTNTDQNNLYEALRWEILDAYFKLPYRNYSDAYLKEYKSYTTEQIAADKKLRDTVARNPRAELSLSYYEGKFTNPLYGTVNIERGDNNDLNMRFEHHPKMYARLQPLGGNRFYVTFSDPVLGKAIFPFTVQNGKVTGFKLKVADFVEMGAYDFKRQ
ncbi:serine hydrolase [Mucilaginibacter sp. UR6-1]|uniref:serine hydrolase n=1 Tax=Mucilaginibacter sp. UR6-1 TaxID=1435643 RepID=UPI001E39FAE3|nr:serine hydrolase [Mucilaginibacter sp. UR6-1]MCC8410543.1 serine hydrolase [Mucilaginibacter sp. UR6-1]